jgi:hypothetical protein
MMHLNHALRIFLSPYFSGIDCSVPPPPLGNLSQNRGIGSNESLKGSAGLGGSELPDVHLSTGRTRASQFDGKRLRYG